MLKSAGYLLGRMQVRVPDEALWPRAKAPEQTKAGSMSGDKGSGLTTASALFQHGIKNIDSAPKTTEALRTIAGDFAYLLFAD